MQNALFPLCLLGTLFLAAALTGVPSVVAAEEKSHDEHSEMVSFSVDVPAEEKTAKEKELITIAGKVHVHQQHEGPPLDFKTDLALWSLVSFVLFVWVLKKFAWGPMASGLDKRESHIRQDIADAEAARHKAEAMLADHAQKLDKVQDEVREILAEARRDAEYTKGEIIAEAQKEAQATAQRATDDIERARDQAMKQLFDRQRGFVAMATERVLQRALTDEDQDRLIEEALSQISEQ